MGSPRRCLARKSQGNMKTKCRCDIPLISVICRYKPTVTRPLTSTTLYDYQTSSSSQSQPSIMPMKLGLYRTFSNELMVGIYALILCYNSSIFRRASTCNCNVCYICKVSIHPHDITQAFDSCPYRTTGTSVKLTDTQSLRLVC